MAAPTLSSLFEKEIVERAKERGATIYRAGTLVAIVRPGERHDEAWVAVMQERIR